MSRTTGEIRAEFLRQVIASGGRISSARFSLQRGLLKSIDPVFIIALDQHGVASLQELPWSSELEQYLLFDARVTMKTTEEEVERFAAILLNNLASAEFQFGKDYAQSVLVELLDGRASQDVKKMLDRVPRYPPDRDSPSYVRCTKFFKDSIEGLQTHAAQGLGYSPAEAKALVDGALCVVLDEAFHITAAETLLHAR